MYYTKLIYQNDAISENADVRVDKFSTKEECDLYVNEMIKEYFEDEENPSFKENAKIYGNGFTYDDDEMRVELSYYKLKGYETQIRKHIEDLYNKVGKDELDLYSSIDYSTTSFGSTIYTKLVKENGELYALGLDAETDADYKCEVSKLVECALICIYQKMVLLYEEYNEY